MELQRKHTKPIIDVLFIALGWWLWHPIGVAIGILTTSGYIRRPVVRTAMHWATAGILIIGVLWGTSMAVAVHTVTAHATDSRVISAALYVWGSLGVAYIGFQSRSADIFDKAGQTATVGLLCYLLVLIALCIIRGWPN